VPQATPTPTAVTKADVKRARAEATSAEAALTEARGVLDQAVATQAEALTAEVAAQDALLAARVRLGDLIAAEDAALVTLTRAATRVEAIPARSQAHRSAFIEWQMAAVAERAAHVRRTVAEEAGAKLFADLQAVEEPLAQAEIALGEAQSAHRRAERAAADASSRVAELETAASAGTPQPAPIPTPRNTQVTPGGTVRAEP
jgi:chromosome segregation ATPase